MLPSLRSSASLASRIAARPFVLASRPALWQPAFPHRKNHDFDTYKYIEKLEALNLTREQAEGVIIVFSEVIAETMQNVTKNMVTNAEQEKNVYMYKVDFAQLKSEIRMIEKNDFTHLKSENDRTSVELEKLKQRMREDLNRIQAGVRLDLNLERGRIRDEVAQHDIKIREANNRIDTLMSNLRTDMAAIKYDVVKYILGTIFTLGTVFLGYVRLLMH